MRRLPLLIAAALVCGVMSGAAGATVRVGVLGDGESEFWTVLGAAMKEAAQEQEIEVDFRIADPATVERQNELAREMIAAGAQALAVCPINPEEQTALLAELAANTPLITLMRDAPESKRLAFMGRDEQAAGRLMAEGMLRHLMPGMKVMAFSKNAGTADTTGYVAGLKEILEPVGTVLDAVKADRGDRMIAQANMEDIVTGRPEIAALFGLEPYHLPAMIRAVVEGDRARMVRVIGMGPAPEVEAYLKQGIVHVLVEEDAAECGKLTLQTLAALAKGEREGIPENGFIGAPLTTREAEGVVSMKDMMNEMQVQAPWVSEVAPGTP